MPAAASASAPPLVITPELATRMLPLVSRIVADLRTAWETWRAAVNHYDDVMAALDADIDSVIAREAQRLVQQRAADVESLRRELEPLGASCRSPRSGRVEWEVLLDGAPVRLLWQPGESAVTRIEPLESVLVADESDDTDPSRS